MPKKNENILDVLVKAYDESDGKTVDLVVDHEILRGVTGAMFKWWNDTINTKERYKLWCPEEHIDYKWEIPPTHSHVGAIHVAVEKFGDYPPAGLRIRFDSPEGCPVNRIYENFGNGTILSLDDKPLVKVCHEFKETPEGIKMRSTFRLPAKTPKRFIEALRRHNISEMGQFPEFLPDLYSREAGLKN